MTSLIAVHQHLQPGRQVPAIRNYDRFELSHTENNFAFRNAAGTEPNSIIRYPELFDKLMYLVDIKIEMYPIFPGFYHELEYRIAAAKFIESFSHSSFSKFVTGRF